MVGAARATWLFDRPFVATHSVGGNASGMGGRGGYATGAVTRGGGGGAAGSGTDGGAGRISIEYGVTVAGETVPAATVTLVPSQIREVADRRAAPEVGSNPNTWQR
jgi:hypothetical protein